MKNSSCLAGLMGAIALLGGCAQVNVLRQPSNIPVFVDSYDKPSLTEKTRDLPCIVNLFNCTEHATLGVAKMSGATEPGPVFPFREIVRDECGLFLKSNFRPVVSAEEAKIELKIESRKVILSRDGDDLTFKLALAVKLLNPSHEDKPYFSKVYEVTTIGTMMAEELVPNCVYEAVQGILDDFAREISSNKYLVGRLEELAN